MSTTTFESVKMNTVSPLTKNTNWRHLRKDFLNSHRAMAGMSTELLEAILAPCTSIAQWILQFQPELLQRDSLSIVLFGAEKMESIDGGRWLRLLPWFLGVPGMPVEVTLVGWPENGRSNAARYVESFQPMQMMHGGISDWISLALPNPDVAFLCQPGFEEHYKWWLDDDELPALLNMGIPIAATSYSEMDHAGDVYMLQSCGLELANERHEHNPWSPAKAHALDLGAFGRVLWCLNCKMPMGPISTHNKAIRVWFDVQAYTRSSLQKFGDCYFERIGTRTGLVGEDGATEELVSLIDDFVVDLKSGALYEVGIEKQSPYIKPLNQTIPLKKLGPHPSTLGMVQKIIWAVSLKRKFIDPLLVQAM